MNSCNISIVKAYETSSDNNKSIIVRVIPTRPSHTQIFDPSIACRYIGIYTPSVYPQEFERYLSSTLGFAQQKHATTPIAKLTSH